MPQCGEKQGGVPHLGDDRPQPVAEAGGKPNIVTQPGPHIRVHPGIKMRFAVRQNLEHKRNGQHAHPGNEPTNKHGARPGRRRNVLGQGKNPGANGGTNNNAHQGPDPHSVLTLRTCRICRICRRGWGSGVSRHRINPNVRSVTSLFTLDSTSRPGWETGIMAVSLGYYA